MFSWTNCGSVLIKHVVGKLSSTEEDLLYFHTLGCQRFMSTKDCEVVETKIRANINFVKNSNVSELL
jgi:hypothetical protein